jgi:hypothetical protein
VDVSEVAMRIAFSIFLSVIVACVSPQADKLVKPYSIVLHSPTGSVRSISEIRLRTTITNATDHDIVFARSPGLMPEEETTYRIDIRDANNKRPPLTNSFRELNEKRTYGGSYIKYVLAAGKSMEDELVLTRIYVLKAGEYKVTVERGARPLWQDPKQEMVISNTISIKIGN